MVVKGCPAPLLPPAAWILRLRKTETGCVRWRHTWRHTPVGGTYHTKVLGCTWVFKPKILHQPNSAHMPLLSSSASAKLLLKKVVCTPILSPEHSSALPSPFPREPKENHVISQVLSCQPQTCKRVAYFKCLWHTYSKTLVALAWATYYFGTSFVEVWHDLRLG